MHQRMALKLGAFQLLQPKKRRVIGVCLWMAMFFGSVLSQENYSTWSDSQRIYINTTISGANITGAVTNFPLLIRLNPSKFTRFDRTKPGGADIRFATSTGVHLNYQIERWKDGAANADTAEIWVKVPSITGNSSTQFIRMYYGNANAVDSSRSQLVFDSNNGFIGAWHLAEDPNGGTAGAIKDATINALHATSRGAMTSADLVNGVIGKAHDFDGTDDADSIPFKAALNTANAVTLSAWVYVRRFQSYSRIITRGVSGNINPWTVYSLNTQDSSPRWRGEVSTGDSTTQNNVQGKNNLSVNTWYHVAFTYDKSNMRIYRNGVQDSVNIAETDPIGASQSTPLMIGKSNYATNPFNGIIDEVNVAGVARSADWIKMSFESQKPTANCVSLDAAVPPTISTQPSALSVNEGASATMTVVAAGTPTLWYEWYKDSVTAANKVAGQTTATLSLPNVQVSDGGNYICVVHNEYGAAQSTPALLSVTPINSPPKITTQPAAITVSQTQPASMTVLATGPAGKVMTYQWYKVVNGLDAEVTGQTLATMTIASTQMSDSGLYRCVVTNEFGSTPSNTAKLTVLSGAPIITVQPKDTVVIASTQARMSVAADGLPPLSYAWYKTAAGSGPVLGTAATLTIASVQLTDAGNYLCMVTNSIGSATSLPGNLKVDDGSPIITVQPRDTSVLETNPWSMSVTATAAQGGGAFTYAWYKTGETVVKGTNQVLSISAASTTHEGTYYCIVFNTFGACTSKVATVSVSPNLRIHNPIMLEAGLVDSQHVLLRVRNYEGLCKIAPDNFFPWSPDTVLIWYKSGSYPTSTTLVPPNAPQIHISKARLKAAGGDQFDTLITVGKTNCGTYYFKGSVRWMNTTIADDSIPPLGDNSTGAVRPMCDNSHLIVPLTMNFDYTPPNDSVVVTINGLNNAGIRWDLVSNLILRYSVAATNYVEIAVSPDVLQGKVAYAMPVRNSRFAGDTTTVKWQLLFRGLYNNPSDTVKKETKVGAKRPDNSLALLVAETDALQVRLVWTNSSGIPYDSFQVWYATTPIPDVDPSPTIYSSLGVSGTLNSVYIRNLKQLTQYFFGIQGMRGGIWSLIPAAAKQSAMTPEDTSHAITNTMKILDVSYDSSTYKVKITYQIDPLGFQHRVGFTWVQRAQAAPPLPEEFPEPTSAPRIGESYIVDKEMLGKPITYEFNLLDASPALAYATEYYFGGWVSKVNEKWAYPTDPSIFYYMIPQPQKVPLVIFKNTDMVTAFNNQVVLRKIHDVDANVTLRLIEGLPLNSMGLVPVGIGVRLEANTSSPIAFWMGLQYNSGLIPAGASVADVHLYYYDTAKAVWMLDRSTDSLDAAASVLYSRKYLNDCKYPFILAVDIVEPVITVTGDTGAVLHRQQIPMTVKVDDNIANPLVSMHVGRGNEELRIHDTLAGVAITSGVEKLWVIDSLEVQGETGMRIHIIADDGRYSKLADVSRDIRFSNADAASTKEEVWIPLGSTGVLDAPSVKQVLDEYGSTPAAWKYDTYRLRLFRYVNEKWFEYNDANQELFSFVPGRIIWFKTRVDTVYDFGDGHSVSLKSPYEITLPAKNWTDFCIPYRFNIRIGDVLKANDDPAVAASCQFYKWQKASGRYTATEFYLPQNGGSKLTDTLYYIYENGDKAAYTVWNDLTTDVVLKIPGTPLAMSTVAAGASRSAARKDAIGWSVAVRSNAPDGELSPVFCAYRTGGSGTLAYPQPPTWSKVNVGIYDRMRQKVYGNLITHEIENGGYTYELVFANDCADRTRVSYTVERLAGENAVEIAVIDPVSGTVSSGESSLSLDVAGNSREYRLLAIGSPEYIDGFGRTSLRGSFALTRISPNPFRGMVRIEYTIPYGGIASVRCDIINHLGRVVWSARPGTKIHPGKNFITWTPDRKNILASGAYFIRLTGYDGKGKQTGEKTAKILYLN